MNCEHPYTYLDFLGGSVGKESACIAGDLPNPGMEPRSPAMQETWVPSLDQEDPLEKGMATTPAFLLENPMDRGAGQATVYGVIKSQTRLSS